MAHNCFSKLWPDLVKQGTSRQRQLADFTCTAAGIDMTNIPYVFNLTER